MRRICDHFGITDSEILLPHHNFSQLVSLKSSKEKAKDNSPECKPLYRLPENSRAVPERYIGVYFLYSLAFVLENLASSNKHGDGIIEASAD